MDQRSFDFCDDESHLFYLQLDKEQQQSLIDQMTLIITTVFQAQEKIRHEPSPPSTQD